jgi:hypothetical protein
MDTTGRYVFPHVAGKFVAAVAIERLFAPVAGAPRRRRRERVAQDYL